ncbi:hypothetical protein PbB2_00073 [Candidatus Phycosocius bacilliformis]|uniref:Uncharacterized protein n=1 Tax=Candidatus Phycosocius bacilliformis TaxID=1445552 RepID=A0A2P2E5T2_9PROT|nr:hypothetical protein [Candidatus Phycosocius bacilliformis]GBF56417.1 hypothetical protein PbB2_00073 [Candidatus Phycosocius bacilliformis]
MNSSIAATALTLLLHASSPWVIGQEREVDQGIYMTFQSEQDGWRIWRIDTKAGVECKAAKSAIGRPHATPLGYKDVLDGPAPRTEISAYMTFAIPYGPPAELRLAQDWFGTYRSGETQFRGVGERFFRSMDELQTNRKGLKIIEVNNVSWEYPALHLGMSEINAQFDLTGIDWAEAQVLACYKKNGSR